MYGKKDTFTTAPDNLTGAGEEGEVSRGVTGEFYQ
jgi:hypothetical protein